MNWSVKSMPVSLLFPSWSRSLRSISGLVLVGAMLCVGGTRTDAKPGQSKKGSSAVASSSPSENTPKTAIDIPIPINHSAQGVCFPIWTGGKLQMRYNMEEAFRVDGDYLRIAQLKLETFDEDGKPEMTIDIQKSMLNLQTRIITSSDPVTIRRTDLELVGKNMTFDTQTRKGKFIGPVRVLIYRENDEAQPTPPAKASPSPTPISE
jgi:hypothetical protein